MLVILGSTVFVFLVCTKTKNRQATYRQLSFYANLLINKFLLDNKFSSNKNGFFTIIYWNYKSVISTSYLTVKLHPVDIYSYLLRDAYLLSSCNT